MKHLFLLLILLAFAAPVLPVQAATHPVHSQHTATLQPVKHPQPAHRLKDDGETGYVLMVLVLLVLACIAFPPALFFLAEFTANDSEKSGTRDHSWFFYLNLALFIAACGVWVAALVYLLLHAFGVALLLYVIMAGSGLLGLLAGWIFSKLWD